MLADTQGLAFPERCERPRLWKLPTPWGGEWGQAGLGVLLEAIDYQPGRLCPLGRDEEADSIHFYLVVRTKNYFLMFEVVTTSINLRTE